MRAGSTPDAMAQRQTVGSRLSTTLMVRRDALVHNLGSEVMTGTKNSTATTTSATAL